MRIFSGLLTIFFSWGIYAVSDQAIEKKDEQIVGLYYFNNMFGHLHQTTNPNSISLTTIACGHPIKVLKSEKVQNQNWFMAEVGAHKGYIAEEQLNKKRPDCFQGSYPVFFNLLRPLKRFLA